MGARFTEKYGELKRSSDMMPVIDLGLSPIPAHSTRIVAVGDVALPEGPVYGPYSRGFEQHLHPDVAAVCAEKDFSIADLECTLYSSNEPISKFGPTLHATPKSLDVIRDGHFDAVTLANNHILDYGEASMFQTRDACEKAGIRTVGIGRSLEDSGRPLVFTHGELRVAIIAITEEEFSCATPSRAGAAPLDVPWVCGLIRDARQQADVVIVVAHCGSMYYPMPSPRIQRWLRALVDAGASAVIAHHSHVVAGMEVYRGAPILYGLGNFVFPFPSKAAPPPCWPIGMIARLTLSQAGIHRVECFLTKQAEGNSAHGVSFLDGPPLDEWKGRLQRLSNVAANPDLVAGHWDHYCRATRWLYFTNLFGCAGLAPAKLEFVLKDGVRYRAPHYAGLLITGLLGRFATGRRTRKAAMSALVNWFRCPSHQEAIIRAAELELQDWPLDKSLAAEFSALTVDCRW